MIFNNLIASVLLASSALVQASPVVPRHDDFVSGFLDALNHAGLTVLSGVYYDYFQTDQGPKLISTLKSQKLSILAPTNDAFGCENPKIENEFYFLNFLNVIGDLYSNKRAPAQSRSIQPTTMPRQSLRKRGSNDQVQVVDTQIGGSSQKRWANETTIFIRGTTTSSKVLSKSTFKNLAILPVDTLIVLPAKFDDALGLPLVDSAPNGFTKLNSALSKTGLEDTVDTQPSITLFAPIDSAFDGCENYSTDQLKSVLENLILKSILFSPSFPSTSSVTALSGNKLSFETYNGDEYVSCGGSKAKILRSDVTTENGAIHVIDTVLEC